MKTYNYYGNFQERIVGSKLESMVEEIDLLGYNNIVPLKSNNLIESYIRRRG